VFSFVSKVIRVEVEAMSSLLEREERELAQLRDALQQALQDKAVAERVQVRFTHVCMY